MMNISPFTRLVCFIFLALAAPPVTWAGSFDQDFAVVFIDQNTEAKFGSMPLNRSLVAKGINAIADAGAKGLVVKFFFDQARDEKDDKRLADSLARIKTVLQARIDNSEDAPNPLAEKFTLAGSFKVAVTGSSGWIPLPVLAKNATDIGFVDFNSTLVPMVEQYKSRNVKSLVLCAVELAVGTKGNILQGKQITIGSHVIKVNETNQVVVKLKGAQFGQSLSFDALLDGSAEHKLRGKIVILAYDGPHIDKYETAWGPMGAHRYFVNILRSIYDAQ
jgi:hypothetical protein